MEIVLKRAIYALTIIGSIRSVHLWEQIPFQLFQQINHSQNSLLILTTMLASWAKIEMTGLPPLKLLSSIDSSTRICLSLKLLCATSVKKLYGCRSNLFFFCIITHMRNIQSTFQCRFLIWWLCYHNGISVFITENQNTILGESAKTDLPDDSKYSDLRYLNLFARIRYRSKYMNNTWEMRDVLSTRGLILSH